MQYSNLISIIPIAAVHLGFAILIGILIQRLRESDAIAQGLSILTVSCTFFLAASLSLPLSPVSKGILWFTSLFTIYVFGWQLKGVVQHEQWIWHYAGFTMSVVLLWSLFQTQALLSVSLGLSAGIAAILSLRKGFKARTIENY